MKTLYVSDLDGTLLRSDQRTSEYTNRTVNALVARGMHFSYATARSYLTAGKVTAGMDEAFPVILYNGAFVRDNRTGELLIRNFFRKDEAVRLVRELQESGISPIVYALVDGEEKFSYDRNTVNAATREFILSRKGDSRVTAGEIFYITCIDAPEKLKPFHEKYEGTYHCVYQRDIYSGEQWLEIMPENASKARAVRQLQELLGCGRLVVFGDGMNDLDLFEAADEAYAVENAVPELKAAATGIIGSNNDDGVAKWLSENWNER